MSDLHETAPRSDLLYGARQIAEYLGVATTTVYTMIEAKRLPVFKMGKMVCARRATIDATIERMDAEGA